MVARLRVGDLDVDVELKAIKNVHLSVYPPEGRVRISAPAHMSLETIRVYAVSRLEWIRKHQRRFRSQERESPREYVDRESHYLWGRRYLLRVDEGRASVELTPRWMVLSAPAGADQAARADVMGRWYRQQVRAAAPPVISRWEPVLGVEVEKVFVRKMRTRWGSCTPQTRSIRLNTELATKPPECLEYIVIHEMAHLLEPSHNRRFVGVMDRVMPEWRDVRARLNRLPIGYVSW